MQGGWAHSAMNQVYLKNSLPLESLRALAGFRKEAGDYFVSRSLVEPPKELLDQVFPFLDKSQREHNESGLEKDLAGSAFLRLMFHLRTVIIQDAAVLLQMVNLNVINC